MDKDSPPSPRPLPQVMVSSTYTDLREHRAALIKAINDHKLHANVMENDGARVGHDVIDSSLKMVRDSHAYVLLIGSRYGQIPRDADRNPDNLSITELEFSEAQRLKRPILLFVMGDGHRVLKEDIERNRKNERKLKAFCERAKKKAPGSAVNRIYAEFNSLEEFKEKIASSLSELCQVLSSNDTSASDSPGQSEKPGARSIPMAPALYAEPDYIGSHRFIGRDPQLQELSDWARPADPTNLLLFEAIGGNGKSMLTWEWVTNPKHALAARPADSPWAGRFWYSFYERGAIMADFCQRALAYMTGRPLEEFAKKKTTALAKDLLAQLHARPWLLILDGLERVLVHYHRIDAAEMPDEEANAPTDKIVNRDPCDAIRDEDNDLLRALAGAKPSKILVSSRLTPRVLLNPAGQTIPGARRINLLGLRPVDAEALLRSCGVSGDSAAIQAYLMGNCDNHPLAIGALGGLINNYLPDRGNFDTWAADTEEGGAALNLASLDLIQRRNHILRAALDALSPPSRQLLSTLALLSESVDYETLKAFNPHLPPEPEEVQEPEPPEEHWRWERLTDEEKAERRKQYETDLKSWENYEQAVQNWLESPEYRAAGKKLSETVRDLERRGLLQWDGRDRKYDLHPVVRGVAGGGMKSEDRESYGQRVVDYFSSLPHNPYEEAEALEDLSPALHVVRTLLKLGHFEQAVSAYQGDLSYAFIFNIEAYQEVLSLLRPFFPRGWGIRPTVVDVWDATYLASDAAIALDSCGQLAESLTTYCASLQADLEMGHMVSANKDLCSIAQLLGRQNRLARMARVAVLSLEHAIVLDDSERLFINRLHAFYDQTLFGHWTEAEAIWQILDAMGRNWPRFSYRPGDAEYYYARYQFDQGTLQEPHLATAERLAIKGKNRPCIRDLHWLRGRWRLEQGDWKLALVSFSEALRMARERGLLDEDSETGLALARHHLGQLVEPRREAERLAQLRQPSHRYLAMLWQAIGDHDQAKHHALAAYKWAWADGEPYVRRYELTKSTELLQQLNVPIPNLPPYDPAKDAPFPWEADVRAAIEKLRAESQAESQAEE